MGNSLPCAGGNQGRKQGLPPTDTSTPLFFVSGSSRSASPRGSFLPGNISSSIREGSANNHGGKLASTEDGISQVREQEKDVAAS